MVLIDTNEISEARQCRRPRRHAAVSGCGHHPQAQLLEQWLVEVLQTYGDRVLDLNGDAGIQGLLSSLRRLK